MSVFLVELQAAAIKKQRKTKKIARPGYLASSEKSMASPLAFFYMGFWGYPVF